MIINFASDKWTIYNAALDKSTIYNATFYNRFAISTSRL